jgi:hypothetical protein
LKGIAYQKGVVVEEGPGHTGDSIKPEIEGKNSAPINDILNCNGNEIHYYSYEAIRF